MKRVCLMLAAALYIAALTGCTAGEISGGDPSDQLFSSETITTASSSDTEAPETSSAKVDTEGAEGDIAGNDIEEADPVIGIEEGANVSLSITNDSGTSITNMYIKAHDAKEYEETKLVPETFADGECRKAYFFLDEEKTYDLKIVYEDGEEQEITELYLGYIPEGTIKIEDGKSIFEHDPLDIEVAPTETTKKKKKSDPDNGCIGDDGALY